MLRLLYSRKWIPVFLSFLLFAGMLIPAAPAAAAAQASGVVTADHLNLRESPGIDAKVLKIIARGQELAVLGVSDDGSWSEVRLPDGLQGWVYSIYIKVSSGTEAVVSVDRLNLRAGPGFNSKVLRVLDLGQEIHLEGRSENSDWLLGTLPNGVSGWVYSAFVDTETAISALPVKEASGGPVSTGKGRQPSYSILVTIWDNRAQVDLAGFPAEKRFSVSLGLPGKEPDLVVAKSKIGANGSAELAFEMPAAWSNDEKITEERLVITVAAEDGSFTRSLNIQYYPW
jgi:uncharacterized protein YraI